MVAGAVFAIIVGVGLTALRFYSSREGYDEPAFSQRPIDK